MHIDEVCWAAPNPDNKIRYGKHLHPIIHPGCFCSERQVQTDTPNNIPGTLPLGLVEDLMTEIDNRNLLPLSITI